MYNHVFVAGTFDGLHKGHRFLLSEAFRQGEKVTIGLTSDEFVKKFKVQNAKFKERKQAIEEWLGTMRLQAEIISIDDPYEPAASMRGLDALVVTSQTRKRGEEINQRRKARGFLPLSLIEIPLVNAADGKPISATRVREGEIDPAGRLVMPEELRPILRKPLGKILTGKAIQQAIAASKDKIVITVGDVTTKTFLDGRRIPNLSIIDLRVGRKEYRLAYDLLRQQPQRVRPFEAKVVSGPGFISDTAMRAIDAWATHYQPTIFIVKGEEDLLALPAIVSAPLGSVVYYGQPGEGMVEVPVNTQTKQKAKTLLRSFLLKT